MSTPIWPATIADDHTHRTLGRDWLTGALAARQFGLGDVVVRFTRLADLPEQQLAAIGQRDPGPYGRITWSNADDTDLGAAVLRGERHRDPQLFGEALRG